MLQIAVELASTDSDYIDMCLKFTEHFLWIASSMTPSLRRSISRRGISATAMNMSLW